MSYDKRSTRKVPLQFPGRSYNQMHLHFHEREEKNNAACKRINRRAAFNENVCFCGSRNMIAKCLLCASAYANEQRYISRIHPYHMWNGCMIDIFQLNTLCAATASKPSSHDRHKPSPSCTDQTAFAKIYATAILCIKRVRRYTLHNMQIVIKSEIICDALIFGGRGVGGALEKCSVVVA